MKKLILIILFVTITNISFSQRHANNWLFGEKAGVTFNDCFIQTIPESNITTLEGVASYSDSQGNLILYTDGVNVFNSSHIEIKNGSALKGHHSATQSAVIVPILANKDQYYIFTVGAAQSSASVGDGFRYSIVDMSRNDGNGEVILKNVLINESSTEKCIAVQHKNNKDTWVLIHQWESNTFCAYLVTENGVSDKPTVSEVGTVHEDEIENMFAYMKVSPDRKRLAIAIQFKGIIELFDFDCESGEIRNPILLQSKELMNVYGLGFSPNSKLLYAGLRKKNSAVYQFDLRFRNDLQLLGSMTKIGEYTKEFGAIQIAPNGKIYIAMKDTNQLAVINEPNTLGFGCYYLAGGIYLRSGISMLGLPTFIHPYFNLCLLVDSIICDGEDLFLSCNEINNYDAEYKWVSPTGKQINSREANFERIDHANKGYFKLYVTVLGVEFVDSLYVNVLPAPDTEIEPSGSTILCEGQSINLDAKPKGEQYSYIWNTGETIDVITVNTSGTYIVTIENEYACGASDTIEVIVTPNLDAYINPSDTVEICAGESIVLMAFPGGDEFTYLWSNGSTKKNIIVSDEGIYSVYVENEIGCFGRDTVFVDVLENPDVKIVPDGPTDFCEGDSLQLSATPENEYNIYLWSNGVTNSEITIFDEGEYHLQITDIKGCMGYDTINVNFIPPPEARIEIIGSNPFCPGDSILLRAEPQENGFTYLWSNGETSPEIWVYSDGDYYLIIANESGCMGRDNVIINMFPQSYLEIIADGKTRICNGETVSLRADKEFVSYQWSNGRTDRSIIVGDEGIYTLTVTDENGCYITDTIEVEYIYPEISGLQDVAFGKVLVGNEKPIDLIITNTGLEDLNITSAYVLQYVGNISVETSEPLPYLLEIGQNMTITLNFAPELIQLYSDSLIVEIDNPCEFRLASHIQGIGVGKSIVSIPDVYSSVGNYATIFLMARINVDGEEANNLNFIAKLRFKSHAIADINSFSANITENYYEGDELIIVIEDFVEHLTSSEATIAELSGTTLLFGETTSPMVIEEFVWLEDILGVETNNGVLETPAVCAQNIRLLEPLDMLLSLTPNPVSDVCTLIIKPAGDCTASIVLYNSLSRALNSYSYEIKGNIENTFDFDVTYLSDGVYFFVINFSGNIYALPIIKLN